jgi:hypothetical protein
VQEIEDGFFEQLIDPNTGNSVIIEDDGEKAYAYLLDPARNITADVWLYNCGPAPETIDWGDRSKLPFQNPANFASTEQFLPIQDRSEVLVKWEQSRWHSDKAYIFIRGRLHAIMQKGKKPGWSRLAIKDGPLAKVLRSN